MSMFLYGQPVSVIAVLMAQNVQVRYCQRKEAPHPCDPPPPCNPFEDDEGDCPLPYICLERLKNPAMGPTRCTPGEYMNAKSCALPDPQHPCDPLPPCSTKKKKRPCLEPTLCYHRIKNPEWPRKPITSDCDPTLP